MKLLTLSLVTAAVWASTGDRAQQYQADLNECITSRLCESEPASGVSWDLRVFGWTCEDVCRYECMWQATAIRLREGQPIVQYYGKWPFRRLMGIQEPASVLFSLMNFVAHRRGLRRIQTSISDKYPLKNMMLLLAYVQMNAWIWSSVFHTRDLPWTEKADYFSAMLNIVSGTDFAV